MPLALRDMTRRMEYDSYAPRIGGYDTLEIADIRPFRNDCDIEMSSPTYLNGKKEKRSPKHGFGHTNILYI